MISNILKNMSFVAHSARRAFRIVYTHTKLIFTMRYLPAVILRHYNVRRAGHTNKNSVLQIAPPLLDVIKSYLKTDENCMDRKKLRRAGKKNWIGAANVLSKTRKSSTLMMRSAPCILSQILLRNVCGIFSRQQIIVDS